MGGTEAGVRGLGVEGKVKVEGEVKVDGRVEGEGAGEVGVVWVVQMGGVALTLMGPSTNAPACYRPFRHGLDLRVREYDSDILMLVSRIQFLSYYSATVL